MEEGLKQGIRRALLEWFRANRRDLPWRGTRDPYLIWLAEVMLQQTQVATVIPYYERFRQRFPTLHSLAEAPLEEVLKEWEGLGYYSRARHLHEAAKQIITQHNGQFPTQAELLRELPGVGRYTAGAVASIAFNHPEPVVDGNVTRVLARLFWLKGDLRKASAQSLLWEIAQQLVDPDYPGDFNQAIMELGATLCLPADPQCSRCPVGSLCEAFKRGEPAAVPEPTRTKPTVSVTDVSALIWHENQVLLAKRAEQGLWGGLWEFPRTQREGREGLEEVARRAAKETLNLLVEPIEIIAQVKHQVTYHVIWLYGCLCRYQSGEPCPLLYTDWRWMPVESLEELPMSTPQRQLAEALGARQRAEQGILIGSNLG